MLVTLISLTIVLGVAIGVTVGIAVASVRNIQEVGRSTETESALPSVLLDRNGRTIVTGYFSNSVDFGVGVETSAGSADLFLLSVAP